MKIGTWNLDACWSAEHESVLTRENCDVWLLTEVDSSVCVPNYHHHFSSQCMQRGQHYAAILSRSELTPLQDPHAASCAAAVDGMNYCSSILPWSTCARDASSPWYGQGTIADMVRETLECLLDTLPSTKLVWGGDWNQNLAGGWQHVGSSQGRARIEQVVLRLGLQVPTANLPHRMNGSYTIDQIALPDDWNHSNATRIKTPQLSDHDAYTIEIEPR